jgi:ABC-type branched-subunit amino acid transport system permease subunit
MADSNDPVDRPRIGVDEWVAEHGERRTRRTGRLAPAFALAERLPGPALVAPFLAGAALLPLLTSSDYVIGVGFDTAVYILLALGLNVVVGFAGLLDLGYIAFFGFGAYAYAELSSKQFDIHWPTWASVPLVMVAAALLGLVLGIPSRRLLGDYLAIVTLFFGQAFVTFVSNANRITPPGHEGPVDFTGGPNGIPNLDPWNLFGLEIRSTTGYFYLALGIGTVVMLALYFLNASRTGRAWRALREDPLAAELMSMPVNRLKLLAFMFGAAIAGLTGTVFAAYQRGVFPSNFDVPLLITVYAMVILGGTGSLVGVAIGAITINVLLEVLRTGDQARFVFYGFILLGLVRFMRPLWALAAVVGGAALLGIALHELVPHVVSGATGGEAVGGGWLSRTAQAWVLLPKNGTLVGNYSFVVLVALVLLLVQLRGRVRFVLLAPTLYLAAFVWENRLVQEPSITRLILLGAILVVLMNARPQGLLGTARVEIV